MNRAAPRRLPVGLVAVSAALVAAVAAPPASAACVGVKKMQRGWTRLELPFDATGYPIFTVDRTQPSRIYAASKAGPDLWATSNGGCAWTKVWSTPTTGAVSAQIQQILVPEKAPGTVLLLLTTGGQATQLWGSTDRGNSFTRRDGGIGAGASAVLAAAPSDPRVLYVGSVAGPFQIVHRSGDGGATWALQTDFAAEAQYVATRNPRAPAAFRLQVDPLVPDELWIFGSYTGNRGLRHSTNGGKTFRAVDAVRNNYPGDAFNDGFGVMSLDVQHSPGKPARIVAAPGSSYTAPDFYTLFRSDDGGTTWYEQPSPRYVRALDHGRGPDDGYADSTPANTVARYDKRKKVWVPLPKPDKNGMLALDMLTDRTGRPALYRLSHRAIDKLTLPR